MDAWIDNILDFSFELTILFRILLSMGLGIIIGIEREIYKRPAGLRTHILVCMASCLIMLVSMYGFSSGDPARIASQVVSGIGFLGAGAILRGEKGVEGITTAATIWMSAMIGLACGNGFYFGAILVTVLGLIILTIFREFERKIVYSPKYEAKVNLVLKYEENIIVNIKDVLKDLGLNTVKFETKIIDINSEKAVKLYIVFKEGMDSKKVYSFVDLIGEKYTSLSSKILEE